MKDTYVVIIQPTQLYILRYAPENKKKKIIVDFKLDVKKKIHLADCYSSRFYLCTNSIHSNYYEEFRITRYDYKQKKMTQVGASIKNKGKQISCFDVGKHHLVIAYWNTNDFTVFENDNLNTGKCYL